MTKQEELDDPNSTWNRTGADEPVFILAGRDVCAPLTVMDWIDHASHHGVAMGKLRGAVTLVVKMLRWQNDHGGKIPD